MLGVSMVGNKHPMTSRCRCIDGQARSLFARDAGHSLENGLPGYFQGLHYAAADADPALAPDLRRCLPLGRAASAVGNGSLKTAATRRSRSTSDGDVPVRPLLTFRVLGFMAAP